MHAHNCGGSLPTREDDGVDLGVLSEDPNHEAGQIQGVDELSPGGSSAPHCEGGVVLYNVHRDSGE